MVWLAALKKLPSGSIAGIQKYLLSVTPPQQPMGSTRATGQHLYGVTSVCTEDVETTLPLALR